MAIIHKPLHPGEIVKDELIDATGMSVTEAAESLGVSRTTLSRLLNRHASLSPEMAVRLAKFFNTSIEMWINIQAQYDTWLMNKRLSKIKVRLFKKATKQDVEPSRSRFSLGHAVYTNQHRC